MSVTLRSKPASPPPAPMVAESGDSGCSRVAAVPVPLPVPGLVGGCWHSSGGTPGPQPPASSIEATSWVRVRVRVGVGVRVRPTCSVAGSGASHSKPWLGFRLEHVDAVDHRGRLVAGLCVARRLHAVGTHVEVGVALAGCEREDHSSRVGRHRQGVVAPRAWLGSGLRVGVRARPHAPASSAASCGWPVSSTTGVSSTGRASSWKCTCVRDGARVRERGWEVG
eukprot:scaffold41751_cov97-Phaeocystis_antarctica.AAC.1